ncbi:MAG TPA: diacylglycerol kinase family protein [Caldilinea sp.]|nr:diacylglycerol kinase family protein [Caldilinea sp.]
MRAKLIFNPSAGATRASSVQITDVIHELQAWKIVPEVFFVEADCDLPRAVKDALAQGIRMFVVCGGDGTISAVAGILAGARATLGIIPSGTQNNMALSLGIPTDIPAAIAILRTGRRIKVDVGMATHREVSPEGGEISTPFLEVCSVGLISTLFPSADDVQHGNLARVGDFLTTFVGSAPAEIHLILGDMQEVRGLGHVVLVSNMPYIGRHYQIDADASFDDGLLDVLFFPDLSKLELLGYIFSGIGPGKVEDPRIQHYHARRVEIDTQPAMPIMADGNPLGAGRVRIEVRRRVLTVMVGKPAPAALFDPDAMIEAEQNAATD